MIIFYDKETGKIKGTIEGRIHPSDHLKMWIGNKKKIGRLVIQWKPVKWYTEDGSVLPNECLGACDEEGNSLARNADFEPDHSQKKMFFEFDKGISDIRKYEVNLKTKKLIKK